MWSPRLKKDRKLLEGVQRRLTKIIPGLKDLTCEQRLEKIKLPSICYRRRRGDLIEVFKYIHNIYKLSDSMLELESRTKPWGHRYKLKKQRCKTTPRQYFFTQRIVDRLNSLPAAVAELSGLNAFNNRVDLFMGEYMYSLE